MSEIYKLEFQVVSALWPGNRFYSGDQPNCRPEEVPNEFWSTSSRETDCPWQQYNTLKEWAKTGEQLVRNVRLFKMVSNPTWEEIFQ